MAVVVLSVGAQPQLRMAVESLVQQSEPVEIAVVNSGGGDVTPLLPAGANITVVTSDRLLWPGAARNAGIRATNAPWIAFLAADLVAKPDWAAQRLALHTAGRKSVASALSAGPDPNLFEWASLLAVHTRRLPGIPRRKALRYGASYARELFERYGLFREDLRIGEDTEFHRRMRRSDRPVWAPQVVAAHQYPDTWRDMVADQVARGERAATHWLPEGGSAVGRGFGRFGTIVPLALRSTRGSERWRTLAALPLLMCACLAYEAGASRGTGAAADLTAARRTVAVAVLDKDDPSGSAKAIVLVDPVLRQLVWIPCELWVPSLRMRLGDVFAAKGETGLLAALTELRFRPEGILCLQGGAVGDALDRANGLASDAAIERQLTAIKAMLTSGSGLTEALRNQSLRQAGQDTLAVLRTISPDWHCCVFDSLTDAVVDGEPVRLRL